MATDKDKDKDKDKALRDMRLEAFDVGYRKGYQQGRLDGAKPAMCWTGSTAAHDLRGQARRRQGGVGVAQVNWNEWR